MRKARRLSSEMPVRSTIAPVPPSAWPDMTRRSIGCAQLVEDNVVPVHHHVPALVMVVDEI